MTSQHVSVHNGEEILWTAREGVLSAFYGGYHLLIEQVIPTPVALTEDRVVICIMPRRYRAFIDGSLPDPENEFYETLEAAKEAAADLMVGTVNSIIRARSERSALFSERPVRYEDWP